MIKVKPPTKPSLIELGPFQFSEDELILANDKIFIMHANEREALEDIFDFDLHEIVSSMWTFEQGLLKTDIINSRLRHFPIDKVWHANYLVNQKVRKLYRTRFCRMIHILNRLKEWHGNEA